MLKISLFVSVLSFFGMLPTPIQVSHQTIEYPNDSAELFIPDPLPEFTKEQEKQLGCVAKAVYFEARGESLIGQRAVTSVIFNRAKSSRFPDNFCEIVYQRDENGCQFSWVCTDHSIKNKRLYGRILADVKRTFDLLRLDQFHDVTHGSLYFSSLQPESHSYIRVGNQYFWRNG